MIVILAWRWLVLRATYNGPAKQLLWIAPRGLITILLYLTIPEDLRLLGFREGIPILVVVLSSIVVMVALRGRKEV